MIKTKSSYILILCILCFIFSGCNNQKQGISISGETANVKDISLTEDMVDDLNSLSNIKEMSFENCNLEDSSLASLDLQGLDSLDIINNPKLTDKFVLKLNSTFMGNLKIENCPQLTDLVLHNLRHRGFDYIVVEIKGCPDVSNENVNNFNVYTTHKIKEIQEILSGDSDNSITAEQKEMINKLERRKNRN